MTSLVDIKKAKEIGKTIRQARESQHLSIQALAHLSGYTIHQMVNLENGNFFAFHESLNDFMACANHCSDVMGVEVVHQIEATPTQVMKQSSAQEFIPAFLQKTA